MTVTDFRATSNSVYGAFILALALLFALGACAALPADGPTTKSLTGADTVRIEPLTLESASRQRRAFGMPSDVDYAPTTMPGRYQASIGDVLRVVVFEGMTEGVFATPAEGGSVFEAIPVGEDGNILLPYIGALRAAGRDVSEIRRDIIARARGFAVRPDALVQISTRNAGSVSVAGAVTSPGRSAFGGDVLTVQDALSRAGAPFNTPYTAQVLIRGQNGSRRATLAQILAGPPLPLEGDTDLIVSIAPATYQALGAVRRQGVQTIATPDLNLLDALGAVGGLDGARANPRGVFVFRDAESGDPDPRPIVYQLDMRAPESFAIAGQFPVLPDDTIYVTEAPIAQWAKVLSAIQGTISLGASAATLERVVGN